MHGIYLVQTPHELDLHNNFDFLGIEYSVEHRTLLLHWRRSPGEWVASGTPAAMTIEFREVSEFRFQPRDSAMPFTEDDCVSSFGYWTDEDWADGVIVVEASQQPDPKWLTAVGFMSGAFIAVQAASAHARIVA
ncbi:MAG: hypothetical protein IPM25_11300 [Chloracidobacterium sp.]|nr:hypothetical protein [Chloracidobacterium sp.]